MSTTKNIFENAISMKNLVKKAKESKLIASTFLTSGGSCISICLGTSINLLKPNQNSPFIQAAINS